MRLHLFTVLLVLPTCVWASVDLSRFEPYEGRTVGRITLTGNRATRPHVIKRELELQVGDPFAVAALEQSVQNLENLGIFGSVTPTVTGVEDSVTLDIAVREMPSYIPYIAFRYTEENGFSVGPALSSVNFGGRGMRISGRALFGGTTTFLLDLDYPWITGNHVSLNLDANHLVRDDKLNQFEEASDEITPWVGTYLGDKGRVRGMIGLFRMESDIDGKTLSDDNSDNFLRVGGAIGWDSRDSWREPHAGWQNEIEAVADFGDGNYLTTHFDVRRFQPLADRHTLYLGGLLSLRTGTVGKDVPEYMQYRLGGANTIRGYDIDVLGRILFGKNQLIGTGEYQYNVLPLREYTFFRWSAAVGVQLAGFVDSGLAWSDSGEFKPWDRGHSGFGVGARLLIPGSEMVRFDVGFSGQGDVFFHFGSWFKWTAQRFRLR